VDLGECELTDLGELDQYDHLRTINNQVASWTYSVVKGGVLTPSVPGEGYVYPYINWGSQGASIGQFSYYYDLYPATYVKTIWDAVFNRVGKSYTSEFLNSEYFKSLIIPFSGDKIQLSENEVLEKTTVRGSLPNGPGFNGAKGWTPERLPSGTWFYTNQINYNLPLDRDTGEIGNIEFTDINGQFNNNIYTTQVGGYYDIDINLFFYPRFKLEDPNGSAFMNWTGNSDVEWRWILQKVSGGVVTELDSIITNNFTPSNQLGQQEIWDDVQAGVDFDLRVSTAVTNIWLNIGDIIRLKVGFRPRNGFKWQYSGTILAKETVSTRLMLQPSRGNEPSYFSIKPRNNDSLGGELIKLRNSLPKRYKCAEFITDIMKMFNLVLVDDINDERNYIIEPADRYFESGGFVRDWNKKIDMTSYKKSPMSEIDSNSYVFKYSSDDDFYNKEYIEETRREFGDLRIELGNNFSKRVTEMQIKFSPTPNSDFGLGAGKIAPQFVNDEFEKKSVKPRILFYDGLKVGELKLRDKPVTPTTLTFNEYPFCGMLNDPIEPTEDLGFSAPDKYYHNLGQYPVNNLFNKFHRRTFNNIADSNSQLLEGYFALTALDMKEFDFRDVIFLFGQYWRVNKIEDFDPTRRKLTKVELYRIIDFIGSKTGEVVNSNTQCPADMISKRIKNEWFIISQSGEEVTQECCESVGGVWVNGACAVNRPGLGPIRPVNPHLEKSGPKSLDQGGNTKRNKETLIFGDNNYQKVGTGGIIIGTNNSQTKNGVIIIGDGISARPNDETSIYLPGGEIKDNGEIIKKYNKIESGIDIVRPLFSKNPEWNLIRGGKDCVRELDYKSVYNVISGNDSERIGYPE